MVVTCANCGEENPERARFCLGCGAPLSAGCPSCGEENPPHARFCLSCGAALAGGTPVQAMPRELRKTVTVVFCDVTGSTTLGERLDPESLRRVMGRYFDEMKAALERHGGTVEKFIGDAVMAVFGIPSVHEDDALRAVRAAAEMRRERDKLNEELERTWGVRMQARIGVNTGEVVAGDAAAGERFATGDTVNVAARLEQAATPGEILIGDETYRLVRDAVRVEPVEPLTLKGKAEPVPAYRLIEVDLWAAGYSRRLDSPLVGRRDELLKLRAEYAALLDTPGARLVTVIGAAGLGKSRLTNEFLDSIEGARVLRGRCLSYGDGVSFWPVMEIVRAAAEIEEPDSIDAARAKIARLLQPDSDEGLVLERVAAAVGLGEGAGSAEETFWGVRKLLEALAAERPVVVLIDDAHWAAPAMLDLIDYVTGWSATTPVLLVCLARPELLDARPSWPTTIGLGPLADEESAELLANLAPELDEALRTRILETAEGNPLYIEQLAALIRDDDTNVQVPPSIHALVAARLDRLQADERATIERGAIEGKVFHRGAVQHLTPESARPSVPANLLTLVRKELIGPDEALFSGDDAFRFRNLVVRDAAYEAMPKQARAELHERFAVWLEAVVGERVAEYDEIVAYHLEQAHRYLAELGPLDEHGRTLGERAAGLYTRAAIPALGRGDMSAARFLYERAVSLYPDDDPRRIALLPELGATLREAGDFAAAEAAFAEAAARGDRSVVAHAAIELAMVKVNTDPVNEGEHARQVAEDAIPVLEELDDQLGLARAWKLLAIGSWLMSHAEMTRAAMDKAIAHARRAGNRAEEIDCLGLLAFVALHGPMPVSEAWRFCDELAEYGGLEASVLNVKGALAGLGGSFDEGRELQRRGVEAYEDLGFHLAALALSGNIGQLELDAGDPGAAEAEVRPAADALLQLGERGYASTLLAVHAEAVYQQGRFEEAAASARQAMELTHEEDVTAQVPALGVLAKVAAQRGRHTEAEELALSAVARIESSDFLQMKGAAFEELGEVLDLVGKSDEARAAREQALELYTQKECAAVAARVRERLAATAPSTST